MVVTPGPGRRGGGAPPAVRRPAGQPGTALQDCIPGVGELVGSFIPVYSLWCALPDFNRLFNPPVEFVAFRSNDLGCIPVHEVVLPLAVV